MMVDVLLINASNQNVTCQSTNEVVATIDASGIVTSHKLGETLIIGIPEEGSFADTSTIIVFVQFESLINYDFQMEYTAAEAYDIVIEIKDANNMWVGEWQITIQPGTGAITVPIIFRNSGTWTPTTHTPGDNYTVFSWIRDIGGNWTTNTFGCSNTGVTITGSTPTVNPIEGSGVAIYPNPTRDYLNVILPSNSEKGTISIANIFQQPIANANNTIDLSKLSSGVNLMRIELEDRMFMEKVMVE